MNEAEPEKKQYQFWRTALRRNLETLKKEFPTLFWEPNMAQERALRPIRKPPYPFVWLNTMANGTGKTNLLAVDMAATLLGPNYVNPTWMNCQYYTDIAHLRDQGKLRTRITCDAEDIRENGSLWTEIHDWIPTARFAAKTSAGTFKQLIVPLPHNPTICNFVDIKTFDQAPRSHAGANLHKSWWNEPGPEDVFNETIGRTRTKKGEVQTMLAIFATVLDEAGYLFDLLDDPEFASRVSHIEGATWENCVGEELPDRIANELIKNGRDVKKDEAGHWITRGVLTAESIENMISAWKKRPAELEARLWGKPMLLGGSIWKNMNPNIHVVKNYKTPPKLPIIQVCDPHDAHDDLTAWFVVHPQYRLTAIAEWPDDIWENMHSRRYSISQTCETWRHLESELDIADRIIMRIGDPNKFEDPDPNTMKTMKQLYSPEGFKFVTTVNDDLEYGHRIVEEMLYYDEMLYQQNPGDPLARPKLLFTEKCPNLSRHTHRYGWKVNQAGSMTNRVSPRFKGGADLVRYACVAARSILQNRVDDGGKKNLSDSERVKRGRNPGNHYEEERTTIGGRRVIGSYRM
jgi:phage terminase large subunit-like protein